MSHHNPAPSYIVKRRTFESYRNPYGRHMKFGPWTRVTARITYTTGYEALLAAMGRGGLYEYALFHRGKRITGAGGALLEAWSWVAPSHVSQ